MTTYDQGYEQNVLDYFARKANDYDLVEEQIYWNLSDKLLWNVMNEHVLQTLPKDFAFLDAGGGTGRWTARILEAYPHSKGLLYDLSQEMSSKALKKAAAGGFTKRLEVRNGKLEDVASKLAGISFDLVFNLHNVLGFVQDVEDVVRQLANLLRTGGQFISFVPNKYHTMFFNIFVGNIHEAEQPLVSGRGRFTADMPYIHMFTPHSLCELYNRNGFDVTFLTGFPILIYPGMQETQLRGSTEALQNILSDQQTFERIYQLERQVLEEPGIAARGNNLFVLGTRR